MDDIYSIPARSFQATSNLGIIFTQFNDLNFYIEDKNKENFYLNIFKKIFPEIQITRIFGLGGKPNVKRAAAGTLTSKKDIYILDLDFDEILGKKLDMPNIFYLQRYSIENYLIEHIGFCEYIKEEKTTLNDEEINNDFNLQLVIEQISKILQELVACCLITDKYDLRIPYYQININRDLNLSRFPFTYRNEFIPEYLTSVKNKLSIVKPKIKFENQLKIAKKHFSKEKAIKNIPGKYFLSLIKFILVNKFGILPHTTNESFNYRLGKNCELQSLEFLKESIGRFTN